MMFRVLLVLLCLPCSRLSAQTSVSPLDDAALQVRMEEVHRFIFTRLLHLETHLIYDYIPPLAQADRWGHLPTAKEIAAKLPNVSGWGAGMEDCAINGGTYLIALVEMHSLTHSKAFAENARTIYQGLRTLGTIGPRKGFVARAVTPDGGSYFPNSSVDQYTMYVCGLWTYFHSPIATAQEKAEITDIIRNICTRIEDDGFDILDAMGKPALVSDIGVIRSDRSSRLLEVYRVGHDITGEQHWLDIYEEKVCENNFARLRNITTPSRVNILPWGSRQMVYGILQNQVSLLPLHALETSLPVRALYQEAIQVNARVVEDRFADFQKYDPTKHTEAYELAAWRKDPSIGGRTPNLADELRTVRAPCEAMCVMLLAADKHLVEPQDTPSIQLHRAWLRDQCRELLSTYDYDKMRTYSMIYAEIAYWRAVKLGLFQHQSK